jgi:hypothetical protein
MIFKVKPGTTRIRIKRGSCSFFMLSRTSVTLSKDRRARHTRKDRRWIVSYFLLRKERSKDVKERYLSVKWQECIRAVGIHYTLYLLSTVCVEEKNVSLSLSRDKVSWNLRSWDEERRSSFVHTSLSTFHCFPHSFTWKVQQLHCCWFTQHLRTVLDI